jgi:DMSO/TMAO reductase YedYZ molybdopterin-dependent catalytic subunit
LRVRPWEVRIDGLIEREITIDIDQLLRLMPLEERVYRHRCVEAWSMMVPWTGFPMKALVDLAKPLAAARYVEMQTFFDPEAAPGQRQAWYPWPYSEGLTIEEATNELAFLATGIYGKPLPKQNGAPLRLAVPWKYGFKSIKSIVRIRFKATRPHTFWERIQPASIRTCRTGAGANRQSACLEPKHESRPGSSTAMRSLCSTSTTVSPESGSSRENGNSTDVNLSHRCETALRGDRVISSAKYAQIAPSAYTG